MAAGRLRQATAQWLLSFTFLTSNLKVLRGIDRGSAGAGRLDREHPARHLTLAWRLPLR